MLAGCAQIPRHAEPGTPTFSRYVAAGFDRNSIQRVLLVPLANESAEPRAAEDIRNALSAEIQSMGRYEVVLAPAQLLCACSRRVRQHGEFDEVELLEIALKHQADAILFGAVTQHRSCAPPRIGLSLRLVSTSEAVVIASVDGLWDASDRTIAEQARGYHEWRVGQTYSLLADDLILVSPHGYQRFVCHAATRALLL
jgi:hypothetical protein